MNLRIVVSVLWGMAGPLLAFEAYGIYQLQQSRPTNPEKSIDLLCADLLQSVTAKGLGTSAKEIESVSGPEADPYFDSLTPFLNARLSSGFKHFIFTDDVRKKSVAEVSRLLERHEWANLPDRMVQTSPDVLLLAEWGWTVPQRETRLTLKAVRLGMTGDGTQASVRFLHPREREREQQRRQKLGIALFAAAAPLAALGALAFRPLFRINTSGGPHHGSTS